MSRAWGSGEGGVGLMQTYMPQQVSSALMLGGPKARAGVCLCGGLSLPPHSTHIKSVRPCYEPICCCCVVAAAAVCPPPSPPSPQVHDTMMEAGAYPSPLNYYNFPKSVCTSVNEVRGRGTGGAGGRLGPGVKVLRVCVRAERVARAEDTELVVAGAGGRVGQQV